MRNQTPYLPKNSTPTHIEYAHHRLLPRNTTGFEHYFNSPNTRRKLYVPLKSMTQRQSFNLPLHSLILKPVTMTLEEAEPNPATDHILDWLESSVTFLPSFLDDPYNTSGDFNGYSWWEMGQDLDQNLISNCSNSLNSTTTTITTESTTPTTPFVSNQPPQQSDPNKKRKTLDTFASKPSQNHYLQKKTQNRKINEDEVSDVVVEQEVIPPKRSGGNGKRPPNKGGGANGSNSNNKDGRWAEQLLNPCASAITARNLPRVQHLLYVLHELATPTGDANHRLAAHGLRALTHHISSPCSSSVSIGPITFASTELKLFHKSLEKFYEASPWFAFHSRIANDSILQVLTEEDNPSRNLHILDIGVSHGMQWPTLLEALTRRSGGPPPLVKLTLVAATAENEQMLATPFLVGPPDDDFPSRLLIFAKSMSINLEINRLENHPLQNLCAQIIDSSQDETLIVCTQFRLHHLNHNTPDDRTEFLSVLRNLEPKCVILSENNMECSCNNCADFATGFSRRVEYLWRFLDSTSSAFKGRESDQRRVMEGEAAKALTNKGEMNEVKEKWCERMRDVGFVESLFGEDAIDGGRALLRKHDSNWEMRVEEKDGCVSLWWKGQPVSFCSLWKLDKKLTDSSEEKPSF
ncbi:Transcription factor GRAS [Dillenia turbinata]|uniref:Transcription factor GRAS n=1 Tax=Dillenia turbinata TaxID=194707 RepID=A0AAN8YT09_9MAGN